MPVQYERITRAEGNAIIKFAVMALPTTQERKIV
jgi:hypothetical protein